MEKEIYKKPLPFDASTTQQVSLNKSQSQDTIRWLLDFNRELEDYRRELRGEVKTADGWIVDDAKRSLNDVGVNEVMKRLRLPFSKGTPLSNMNDDEIRADAKDFNIQLALDAHRHYIDWGFKSYGDRTSIISQTSWMYFKLLLRAKGALQLKQLSESIERQEKVMYGQPKESEPRFYEFWRKGKK